MIKEIFLLQNPWRKQKSYSFNNLLSRDIFPTLVENLFEGKALGLLGSRQVGKSSLMYLLISELLQRKISKERIFYFNLDESIFHSLLEDTSKLIDFIKPEEKQTYIFIDEIQRLSSPGLILKRIYDLKLNISICYSGSSQLEIRSKIKEHLVGRTRQFVIPRLSFKEYLHFSELTTSEEALNHYLLFGAYPEVVKQSQEKNKILNIKDIYDSYIKKDIIDYLQVKDPNSFNKLLSLLSLNSGQILNIDNLSNILNLSRVKIEHYLSVLESTFIIKLIPPFHRNYKKEIKKSPKIFFLDLGLRNFAINNFQPLQYRQDKGSLFENFYLLQLIANDPYQENKIKFWRTTNQTEIDFIVEKGSDLRAFEVKWANKNSPKSFKTIRKYYPSIKAEVVTKEHFVG